MHGARKIIVHGGLHKTATTFMQNSVFPLWEGLAFSSFESLNYTLKKMHDKDLLISNEGVFGSPWYPWDGSFSTTWAENRLQCLQSLKRFTCVDGMIVSFRKHSDLLKSLYCQYVQEGGYERFEKFFDLKHNSGLIKKEDIVFEDIISVIEKTFGIKAFVFFSEELKTDLFNLVSDLEKYIGGSKPEIKKIIFSRNNESIGHYQLLVMRNINRYSRSILNERGFLPLHSIKLAKIGFDMRTVFQKKLAFISKKKFSLDSDVVREIDTYYRSDFIFAKKYSDKLRGSYAR